MTAGEMVGFTKRLAEIKSGVPELKRERLRALSDDLLQSGDPEKDPFLKAMFITVIEEMHA
jgi:hypothetical protein